MTKSTPRDSDSDSTPNDFGVPALHYKDQKPMTKEQEEEYLDKLSEMQSDL